MTLAKLAGYRKLVAFMALLGYLAWLACMETADPALGTLAASAVTAFGVYITGHVFQERKADPPTG